MIRCQSCQQDNLRGNVQCAHCGAMLPGAGAPVAATPEMEMQIQTILKEKSKIEAIKWFREQTGAGLKEAKDAVEAIDQGRPFALPGTPDQGFESELIGLLQSGSKIEAIKRYREKTGAGLKEAKDAVERLAAAHGLPTSSRTGCLKLVLLATILIVEIVFA